MRRIGSLLRSAALSTANRIRFAGKDSKVLCLCEEGGVRSQPSPDVSSAGSLQKPGAEPHEALTDSQKAHRSASGGKGEQSQAIGRLRGGRSTKIHALTDRKCRPIAFMLTGGQVADCGRLKDFRRVATRYDRLTTNVLAAICLAATVSYWL